MTARPAAMAWESTKRVWGMGPSAASHSSRAPSAMRRTRSTSPPKSAWPGVSMTLILTSLYSMEMFLARMVMPRSRSWSLESSTRSSTCGFARKASVAFNSWSTSVVLPWSTCAMIAMFLMFSWRICPSRLVSASVFGNWRIIQRERREGRARRCCHVFYSSGSSSPAGWGSVQPKVSSSPVTSTSENAE